MNELALAIYHRLPGSIRSVAASTHGGWLRLWRYGPESERLIEEAAARETWSAATWHTWRGDALARLLRHAAVNVPYYRELWADRRRQGDRRSPERLEHWPILEKDRVRRSPRAFLADGCNPRRMFHEHTSGTTGTSLDLWWSKDTVRQWFALFEGRCRRWHGVTRHDRWAILGGQLVTPAARRQPPFWVWNAPLNQLYCSSYHLAPDLVPSYLDAWRRYEVTHVVGYPSALYELAETALRTKRTDIALRVAITNAEPLFDYQREAIRAAFRCDVRDTYGMAEIVAAGSECGAGTLHQWPEVGVLEVRNSDGESDPETAGDLIATGLLNVDMPLIRYRVGDRVALSRDSATCTCGRTLPGIRAIEGRSDDVLLSPDGRRIGRLDPVFKRGLPIREAQIVQEALDRIRVRYVPLPEFDASAARRLTASIQARIGDVHIVLEPLQAIPRDANRKFRTAICAIPEADRLRASELHG